MTDLMAQRNLRSKARISYYEPEEPALDEYVFCEKCGDFVYEYCSIHGPLLVIPDDKVPAKPNVPSYVPRAALTIPHVFLHITYSIIPDAGLGVFSSMTLPSGVRFGPYRGQRTDVVDSSYCWQIYDKNRKPVHCIDAADTNKSNWMRYVNCARHWKEQNLVAYQYRGELYYRTIKIIPRFTELMVFYGSELACELDVDLGKYNSPPGYAQKFGAPVAKKRKLDDNSVKTHEGIITFNASAPKKTTTSEPISKHNIGQGALTSDIINVTLLSPVTLPTATVQEETTNDQNKKNTNLDIVVKKRTGNENKKYNKTASSATIFFKSSTEIKKDQLTTPNIKLQEIKSNKNIEVKNETTKDLYVYCDECNIRCVTKLELQKHLRFHDTKRTYACEICKKAFNINIHLKIHMRTHTGEKLYVCEICKKAFSQNSDLKKHMRTHTGEKPYVCEICKKVFSQNGTLNLHMRTHTGEKPYVCEICKKAFSYSGTLKLHMRSHTGEKPYVCEICKKAFSHSGTLKLHMRSHTGEKPYVCEICKKAFSQNSDLKKHMRTHTGEKPYVCEICKKAFSQNSDLKKHMRTHTGEKPYVCEICNTKFGYKNILKKHLIKKHLKEVAQV